MKYATTVWIHVDIPDDLVLKSDTRKKRQALISADMKKLIEDEVGNELFTWFDVQVITVESDD